MGMSGLQGRHLSFTVVDPNIKMSLGRFSV
jgi:hypothetical protein